MKQKTISKTFCLSGLGLHSGSDSSLYFSPAPTNTGIVFVKNGREIPAHVSKVKETRRGTFLEGISVVEHLLSAAYGLGVDNLRIEIKGDEPPALDGSALPYVESLLAAGIVEQREIKNYLYIEQPIKLIKEEASLEALPYRGFKINFTVDFPGIGTQHYLFDQKKSSFEKEIAPARTFGYIDEYEILKEQGLARGASFENSLVLGKDGYINNPRFQDELVRHKILDLIGDLALLGRPVQAEIIAVKSGHEMNIELVRRLLKR
jgi:UDP-3-O-acyl N-acetylglucosamine deacetylase